MTVIAAGFDRWEDDRTSAAPTTTVTTAEESMTFLGSEDDQPTEAPDLFGAEDDDLGLDDDDDFDVPSFLK